MPLRHRQNQKLMPLPRSQLLLRHRQIQKLMPPPRGRLLSRRRQRQERHVGAPAVRPVRGLLPAQGLLQPGRYPRGGPGLATDLQFGYGFAAPEDPPQ